MPRNMNATDAHQGNAQRIESNMDEDLQQRRSVKLIDFAISRALF